MFVPIYYIKLEHLTHKNFAVRISFQHSWAIHSGEVHNRILPEYATGQAAIYGNVSSRPDYL